MILSIVIPVYGVEKYISDCINSFIDNIDDISNNVEVILIDDGCKDRSIEVARRLIKELPCFKIISQQNQGLSVARNNGLHVSTGDYVWFVDSDDMIAPEIVSQILAIIERFPGIDMFEFEYKSVKEDSSYSCVEKQTYSYDSISVLSGKDRLLSGFYSPVPFHLFRREFLMSNNLQMYSGIYHEDGEFTPRALWLAENVAVLPWVAYYYRQREGSIMHSVNSQKGVDNIFVAHRLKVFFDNKGVGAPERRIIDDFISMAYCNGLHSAIGATGEDRERIEKAAFEHRAVLQSLREASKKKYRVLGTIASLFSKHIVSIYLIMMRFNKKTKSLQL